MVDNYYGDLSGNGKGVVDLDARPGINSNNMRQYSIADFATGTEYNSFQSYSAAISAQNVFDIAIDTMYNQTGTLYLPLGKFPINTVNLPYDNTDENRGKPLQIIGSGIGEAFVFNDAFRRGTVLVSQITTAPTIVTRRQVVSAENPAGPRSGGTFVLKDFRVEGTLNSGVPLVHCETFYGQCVLSGVAIHQFGDGDGLRIDYMATSVVDNLYILGKAQADGVGAVGRGLWLKAQTDAALQTFRNVTSRGFLIAYQWGETTGNAIISGHCVDSEVSYCTYGHIVAATTKKFSLTNSFIEGCTANVVIDAGFATSIENLFTELYFQTAIVMQGRAGSLRKSFIGMNPNGSKGVEPSLDATTFGAEISGNYFRWNGIGTNIVGISITAEADPKLEVIGNRFDPVGQWAGAGNAKISDISYSSYHGGSGAARGSGVFGNMQRETADFNVIPALSRGTLNLHVENTKVVDAQISGTTLTLTAASVHRVHFTSARVFDNIVAPNWPDKTGQLIFTNGNVTINPSVNIGGISRALQVPAGRKLVVDYQVIPSDGGTAAMLYITNVHLENTSFTNTELGSTKGDFSQVIYSSTAACPVWWNGANWKKFSDNATVV